jgi:hypothetical protein
LYRRGKQNRNAIVRYNDRPHLPRISLKPRQHLLATGDQTLYNRQTTSSNRAQCSRRSGFLQTPFVTPLYGRFFVASRAVPLRPSLTTATTDGASLVGTAMLCTRFPAHHHALSPWPMSHSSFGSSDGRILSSRRYPDTEGALSALYRGEGHRDLQTCGWLPAGILLGWMSN